MKTLYATRVAIFIILSSVLLLTMAGVRRGPGKRAGDATLSKATAVQTSRFVDRYYGFSFQYPASWARVRYLRTSLSDFYAQNGMRWFVAAYIDSYPAQDYDGGIDVYPLALNDVLNNHPYVPHGGDPVSRTTSTLTWTCFKSVQFDSKACFTGATRQTYAVVGTSQFVDAILPTFTVNEQVQ